MYFIPNLHHARAGYGPAVESLRVNQGASFGYALGASGVFPELYVSMVRAGELGGALESVLERLADYLESQVRLRNKVGSILIYPLAMFGFACFLLAPVLFFYVMAHMVWRAQELRVIAQSMASVAMKLAEPEEVARESMVSVGQAIRREVAAMGDGVERALARAAELEALVANEVSALERAYNDNEVRIRGLLETLAQGLAFVERHDDEQLPIVLADLEDRADVGIIERAGGMSLSNETSLRDPVPTQHRREELQRHISLDLKQRLGRALRPRK